MTWKHFSLEQAAVRFDNSQDLTIGIEEEFQILDSVSLELINRFEDLHRVAHPRLGPNVSGELIASEIEINTRKCSSLNEAEADLKEKRRLLMEAAKEIGVGLAASGTHPFSDWKEQRILNTAHYREVEERLRYLAWKNLTYGMHVHVGIRGRERMIAVFNSMRGYLPCLLALSANSPFTEGRYTYIHSTRAQIFTRSFPRCDIPGAFKDWNDYATFVDMLFATNSIGDPMQIWWSLRPHPWFGTLEIRICDCQTDVDETMAVAALTVALISQLAEDYDNGKAMPVLNTNQLDENLWRATRYGLDGKLVDFDAGREIPASDALQELLVYTAGQHSCLKADRYIDKIRQILREGNGAQRQIRHFERTGDITAVFEDVVNRSRFEYTVAGKENLQGDRYG